MGVVTKYTSTLSGSGKAARTLLASELANYVDDQGKGRLDRSNRYFQSAPGEPPSAPTTSPTQAAVLLSDRFKRGEIHLEGFLASKALMSGISRSSPVDPAAKREWINKLSDLWSGELVRGSNPRWLLYEGSERPRSIALKIIISPDPDDRERLLAANVSLYDVMGETVHKGITTFVSNQGMKDNDVGYLWSLHLDKDHVHAHVLLFPWTKKGEPLRLSDRMRVKGVPDREDNLTAFRNCVSDAYDNACREALQPLPQPPLLEQLMRSLGARAITAQARAKDSAGHRAEVIKWTIEEFQTEGASTPLTEKELGPMLDLWIRAGSEEMTKAREVDGRKAKELEPSWWRWLWIALAWRRRRRGSKEAEWEEVARLASEINSARSTGPTAERLPELARNAAENLRPRLAPPSGHEPSWALPLRVRVEEWLNISREILMRSLVLDCIAEKGKTDPVLRGWFTPEILGTVARNTVAPTTALEPSFALLDRSLQIKATPVLDLE